MEFLDDPRTLTFAGLCAGVACTVASHQVRTMGDGTCSLCFVGLRYNHSITIIRDRKMLDLICKVGSLVWRKANPVKTHRGSPRQRRASRGCARCLDTGKKYSQLFVHVFVCQANDMNRIETRIMCL